MGKKRTTAGDPFDPATRARLAAVGRYEVTTGRGLCEVRFGRVPALAADLTDFGLHWYLGGPGKAIPAPAGELFDLWDRYRAAHPALCGEYRRFLAERFARSAAAGYDDHQWAALRRSRPHDQNLRGVVSRGTVEVHQRQGTGEPAPTCEVQVSFVVFWDEHGVALRLREAGGGFAVAEWSVMGGL